MKSDNTHPQYRDVPERAYAGLTDVPEDMPQDEPLQTAYSAVRQLHAEALENVIALSFAAQMEQVRH